MYSKAFSVAMVGIVGLLAACTSTAVLYAGPTLDRSQVAVVSTIWGSPSRKISALVTMVDDKPFDSANHKEMHLLPGQHTFTVRVKADGTASLSMGTIRSSWNETSVSVTANLVAGHTYIPKAERVGNDGATATVEDRGSNYPERCMPLTLLHAGQAMDACDSQR
jgi:hypothetical protein